MCILPPASVSTAQLTDCSAPGGWPCFLGFSRPPPPPLALAPPMLLAPPGGPPSLGHSPPRFLHGFPHPSPPPGVRQGHVLRRPDLPKTCRVLPSHPAPCPFATGLGDMLSCAPAVTVSLSVLHWPLRGQGWEGACLRPEQSRCSATVGLARLAGESCTKSAVRSPHPSH